MSGRITFNGITSASLGVRIGGVNVYGAPGRSRTAYQIPGVMGVVFGEPEPQEIGNELRQYEAAFFGAESAAELETKMDAIRQWLLGPTDYVELTDSYEPGVYRQAVFDGDLIPTRKGAGQNQGFPLTFSCRPQRFLTAYKNESYILNENEFIVSVTNPTPNRAYPLLRLLTRGVTGILSFWDEGVEDVDRGSITVANTSTKVVMLDTETEEAYWRDNPETSANDRITAITGDISLHPGVTIIKISDAEKMYARVHPRFWVR
jgi:phage-related protein